MDLFFDFINCIANLSSSHIFEDKKSFTIEFTYDKSVNKFLNDATLSQLNNIFLNTLSLYVIKNNFEINLFDFIDDEDLINEVNKLNQNYKLKIVFNKTSYIQENISCNANVILFVQTKNLINKFNRFSDIENDLFSTTKKNVIILYDSNDYFHNDFYMITNINRVSYLSEIEKFSNQSLSMNYENIINTRNEMCNWVDGSHFLIPEYLFVNFQNTDFESTDQMRTYILKYTVDLIIAFIGNFTGTISDENLTVINGTKRIEIYYDLDIADYTIESYDNLYKLYCWIYDNSTFDKINICRNVISILITAKCQGSSYKTLLTNSDWLLKSVQDNFKSFLKSNIKEYFKEQNILMNKLYDNISSISKQISELTKLSVTNITSLLGTIIAAVIGYIAKGDLLYIKILTVLYLSFLWINSLLNLPISIIRVFQYRNDFKSNKDSYEILLPDDQKLEKLKSRNTFNTVVYFIYIAITIIINIIITRIPFIINIDDFIKLFE
ncbi:hypothetical protein FDB29_07530 [Clostridium botulinum]|nr:hypothetical protein [Clostridium botulinum]